MTDRAKGLIVSLEHDMRVDDVEAIVKAIGQLRGVIDVQPVLSGADDLINRMQIRHEMGRQLWQVLYPEKKE